jgi:peptidyl-prolyl cis-trans isomerase SurA
MKKAVLAGGILFVTLPLWAQTPPASQPEQQGQPAQQAQPAQQGNPPAQGQAPAQNPPTLEKPQMEAPPEAQPEEKQPEAKKPDVKKPAAPAAAKKTGEGEGKVVEEIIARVNNDIITRSELEKAQAQAEEDARQDCSGKCTPEQLQTSIEERQKTALRDLIDQSLLAQRGKDMGINVETDLVKQLDQIRIGNKLPDMDALEKAVTSQGMNWDDFKANIRNRLLTSEVIREEVGRHITITREEEMKYYEDHKQDYQRQEQVALSSILVKTEGKKESELPELKAKAQKLHDRVKDGEDFGELAKRFSDGPTAQQGGFLGVYKKGELNKQLEEIVFKMNKNELTDVIDTAQGYLVMKVLEHYDEGIQPFTKVENEISEHLYNERMEPALKEYLKTLREQSYVVIKPGYADLGGGGNSEILEVSATPEVTKVKKGHKKFLLFGKNTGGSGGSSAAAGEPKS